MNISDFDYTLPKKLIAQKPAVPRDRCKLMIVGEKIEHRKFSDIIDYLKKGDVLVINDTAVIPCKITGKKETGSLAECILEKKIEKGYICKIKGRHPIPGRTYTFRKGITGKIIGLIDDSFIVHFNKDPLKAGIGTLPMPPYVTSNVRADQYQTMYAQSKGSLAAPTAGLHFTPRLMRKIEAKGIKIAKITLHISFATFMQVRDIDTHKMHKEYFEITQDNAKKINERTGRLVAVGTTTLKALESAADTKGIIYTKKSDSDLFIKPPHTFRSKVDLLITNFHLPRSTLILLVSAFSGKDMIKKAYDSAVKKKYMFYSLGDAMLLENSHPQ